MKAVCERVMYDKLRVKELCVCVKGCTWKTCVWKFVCSSLLCVCVGVKRLCVWKLCVQVRERDVCVCV